MENEGSRQVNREVMHYNLQLIIAVGFKVNNQRAVQFRKWAGQIVKDHTIQGWTMDVDTHDILCEVLPVAFGDVFLSQENRPESMDIQ